MADVSGVEVLKAAKELNRDIIAFMMTAFASTETAVEAMRLGAVDYFTKPFSMDELRLKIRQHLESSRLKQENVLLKRALNTRHEFSNIIGRSDGMLAVFRMIETVAEDEQYRARDGRVWHRQGARRSRHSLQLAPARPSVRRAQLWGSARNAARVRALRPHAGGVHRRGHQQEGPARGRGARHDLPRRNRGDERRRCRSSSCEFFRSAAIRRLGGTEESQADIRIVAATNQDLARLVADGRFREDLYYRINVIPMHLPPLRERREDIPLLAAHFLEKHSGRAGASVRSISQEATVLLTEYQWPGNVRELENVIERCVALEQTPVVLAETLPANIRAGGGRSPSLGLAPMNGGLENGDPTAPATLPELGDGFDLEARGEEFYRHYIALALERANGVQVKAAEMLGMSFRSFRYYAKKLRLR